MQPQLIIDNDASQPIVINILRGITASTLLQPLPEIMTALLTILNATPGTVPTLPTIPPLKIVA